MKTEDIEKQLFIITEEKPTEEKSAHLPHEEDEHRKYQLRMQKEREEWEEIINSKDSEFIKCYRKYRHTLSVNHAFFVDGDCWDIILALFDKLKIDKGYVLDDYRSKASTDNILNLYARHENTPRPSERKFIEWEYYNERFSLLHASRKLGFEVNIFKEDNYYPGFDEPKDMPPMIPPHEVITLDFDALSIWEAYLLRLTNYFIGQRWHGNYHKMEMIFDPKKDIRIFMMQEEERMKYAHQLEELHPDYEPYVTINGNTAKVKHLALIGDTRITECTCTITYNPKTRKIEKFEFDDSVLIEVPRCFYF